MNFLAANTTNECRNNSNDIRLFAFPVCKRCKLSFFNLSVCLVHLNRERATTIPAKRERFFFFLVRNLHARCQSDVCELFNTFIACVTGGLSPPPSVFPFFLLSPVPLFLRSFNMANFRLFPVTHKTASYAD